MAHVLNGRNLRCASFTTAKSLISRSFMGHVCEGFVGFCRVKIRVRVIKCMQILWCKMPKLCRFIAIKLVISYVRKNNVLTLKMLMCAKVNFVCLS